MPMAVKRQGGGAEEAVKRIVLLSELQGFRGDEPAHRFMIEQTFVVLRRLQRGLRLL